MNGLRWLVLRRLGREALLYAPWPAAIWLEQAIDANLDFLHFFVPVLMASLLLKPWTPLRVLERFAPRAETEWRLAKGIWSRRDLTHAFLAETVGSSLLRAAMYTLLSVVGFPLEELRRLTFFSFGLGLPQLFSAAFLFALGSQSAWFVIANAPGSQRTHNAWRRGDLLRTQLGEWATNFRLLLAIGLAIAVFGVSTWATSSPWGLIVPAFGFLALLAWILPAVETTSGGSGASRWRVTKSASIVGRSFAPMVGLLWEGSYRSTKLQLAFCVLLTILAALPESLLDLDSGILAFPWLIVSFLLFNVTWKPFRWRSSGDGARFLWTAGVDLQRVRRAELLFGLGVSHLAIASVLVFARGDVQGPLVFCLFWPVCPVLLLCNRAPLALPGLKRVRVCDRTTMFLGCLVATVFVGITGWFPGGLIIALFVVIALSTLAAWTWAFVRAGDDEALRRFEFDRLSGVR